MTLQQAKDYINYGIKEGSFSEDIFEGMTDGEIIGFAEDESGRAEAHYDPMRDEELI